MVLKIKNGFGNNYKHKNNAQSINVRFKTCFSLNKAIPMDTGKAYLRLLLNDLHVDLEIFLEENNDQHSSLVMDIDMRIHDFKERLANLDNANKKYDLDFIKDDVKKLIISLQNNSFLTYDKEEILRLQNITSVLLEKILKN